MIDVWHSGSSTRYEWAGSSSMERRSTVVSNGLSLRSPESIRDGDSGLDADVRHTGCGQSRLLISN